ncbi:MULTISPECIES: hypothetical protein [unclassified Acinetobacter]|uniref:hypothetical protein n=1 Tax=unclassified Acinetobacter TaxID=196816 RepID=UPI001D0D57A9|nr:MULTISPECIES: hypothetical protein [unclassified Acinetobacter]
MLYNVAYGKVDTEGREQLLNMAGQWDQAGANTADRSLERHIANMKFAAETINSMSGKVLTDNNGKPIIENGSAVKAFQATDAQRKNNGLFGYDPNKVNLKAKDDPKGGYFRVFDPSLKGKRKYLDLNGNVPSNKTLPNGKKSGRSQAEYNEETHFKIDKVTY